MPDYEPLPESTGEAVTKAVDAIYKVHKVLGPGLLESVYETCLLHEFKLRSMDCKSQVALPLIYEGYRLESGLRLDMLVEDSVIIEIKAIETLLPVHEAQLLTYLKLTGKRLGLLVNFNVPAIRKGIKRIIL